MPISTIGSNSLNQTSDLTINGVTVGKGANSVAANTALGTGVLASGSLSGGYNTAIGFNSLAANTSGTNNTAIGNSALNANTTASDNQAFGTTALYLNTTGSLNTAVGRDALRSNTTGSYNTATGYQAGYSNAQGSANTFLGYQAGYTFAASSATSTYNTFLGYSAGYLATTGTNNTFVGNGAGQSVTTGGKNTILGNYGGNQGSVDIRTSSNNIVLSDGDGNPRMFCDGAGYWNINTGSTFGAMLGIRLITATTGDGIITRPDANVSYSAMVFKNSSGGNNGYISVSNSNTTSYVTTSDYRLKENVTPMTGALAKVAQLKPVTYDWKSGGSSQGFIAHELQAVVPDAVVGEKDALDKDGNPDYQGIDTSFLVATLTAAIQELKTIVDAQAAEIAELKAKVA